MISAQARAGFERIFFDAARTRLASGGACEIRPAAGDPHDASHDSSDVESSTADGGVCCPPGKLGCCMEYGGWHAPQVARLLHGRHEERRDQLLRRRPEAVERRRCGCSGRCRRGRRLSTGLSVPVAKVGTADDQ